MSIISPESQPDHTENDPPCLVAALDYVSRGWSAIALMPRGKKPIGTWEAFQTRILRPGALRQAWKRYPDANVGVVLGPISGLIGLDLDGPEALARYAELAKVWGGEADPPPTLTFKTGSGGLRLLYRLQPGEDPPQHSSQLDGKELVRFQGRGGQTVMPPSIHPNGNPYTWVAGAGPDEIAIALRPDWILRFLASTKGGNNGVANPSEEQCGDQHQPGTEPAAVLARGGGYVPEGPQGAMLSERRPDHPGVETHDSPPPVRDRRGEGRSDAFERARKYVEVCARQSPAIQGQRGSDQTIKIACRLALGFRLSFDETLYLLRTVYNPACQPPWSEKELRHKVEDALEGYSPDLLNAPSRKQQEEAAGPHSVPPDKGREPGTEWKDRTPPMISFPEPIPASQLVADATATPIWSGYLYPGEITLLTALWKAGKTTFLAHLLRAMQEGGVFCGRNLLQGKVLYVTEESKNLWLDRRDKLSLGDNVEFQIRPFKTKADMPGWRALNDHLRDQIAKKGFHVVVLDTVANLWPVKDENAAAEEQAALIPLQHLGGNTAIILVHHNRKSDGQEGTAARGSGALPGFVDTIIELRRYDATNRDDHRRVLTGYGRHDETPHELVVALNEQGDYVALGDRKEIQGQDLRARIQAGMRKAPPGEKQEEIITRVGARKQDIQAVLNDWETHGWRREGTGKKGSPFTYWCPQ